MPAPVKKPRVALTPRDVEIFLSLSHARYLTVEGLEWLHFPQWKERYLRWKQACQEGASTRYKSASQAYTRLQQLTDSGYIGRVIRPVMLAVNTYQRESDLFFLKEKSAQVLAVNRGVDLSDIHYGEPRQRSYLLLEHHAAVGRVYAALRSRIAEREDLSFQDWRSEHDFAQDFDRVTVAIPLTVGGYRTQEQGIQPDGAFTIGHSRGTSLFFVEVERDQPLAKWKDKVWAYEAYLHSPALAARFGIRQFTLLGIGLNPVHQRRLLEATGEALALLYSDPQQRIQALGRYRISHMDRVHPTTIGSGWQVVTRADLMQRGGAVPFGAQIATEERVLVQ